MCGCFILSNEFFVVFYYYFQMFLHFIVKLVSNKEIKKVSSVPVYKKTFVHFGFSILYNCFQFNFLLIYFCSSTAAAAAFSLQIKLKYFLIFFLFNVFHFV